MVVETGGFYDYANGGMWQEGNTNLVEKQGATVPLTNQDLQYDENGTYTTEDRKIYTYEDMVKGDIIEYDDMRYTIQEKKDYSEYDDGLYLYWARRES